MTVVVVFEDDVLRLIRGYAPQSRKRLEENLSYYDELRGEWEMHYADRLVMCLGDFNERVGRHIDDFYGMRGGYGVGQRKLEGIMLLVLYVEGIMCIKYMIKERGKAEGDIQNGWT